MVIDHCLITAAGLGTRMGEIGKSLPKILWPVFETNLLELQIKFAQRLGAKKIFLNGHFLSPLVAQYIREKELPVTFVHEDILLDVGGAIYNVASLPEIDYSGIMLVLNGDQFLFFDEEKLHQSLAHLADCDGALFGIKVDGGAGYRETIIENGRLVDIVAAHDRAKNYQTYSGVALFNLARIERRVGVQPFFESIADYRHRPLAFIPLEDYQYWDFGTAKRYASSLFDLVRSPNSPLGIFLDEVNGWDREKIGHHSYRGGYRIINMGKGEVSPHSASPSIILGSNADDKLELEEPCLCYYRLRVVLEGWSSSSG